MSSGFSLVELLIATFIASILGALLFTALYQMNRFVPRIDNTTAVYEKAALVNAQLERDISGATAPNEYYYRLPEPEKKATLRQAQDEKGEKKKGEEEKKKRESEKKEKEEGEKKAQKPLEKVFYSTNKDGNLNQLSFLTTNPLQVYWSAKAGSAKPRIARVLYTLKEEKGSPKSYSLIRQESPNLEFEAITKTGKEGAQEFVLADGIKSLVVEYTYIVPEKKTTPTDSAQAAPEKKEPKKKEIKKSTEWTRQTSTPQSAQSGAQPSPEQIPVVPTMAELKFTMWDSQKKRSTPFTFKIKIPSDIPEKRETEDVSQKLLGTLREFFTQGFGKPQPTTRLTTNMKPNTNFLNNRARR